MFDPDRPTLIQLSICIATLNRADVIGATLESILPQLPSGCELVVLDCGSTDGTAYVVAGFTRRFECLRYIRQEANNGLDQDYDEVVGLARGEYCWLMTDDDLMKRGAVHAVLHALARRPSLVIVNVEYRTFDMSRVLQSRRLSFESDRVYAADEMGRLFHDVNDLLKYIACIVIRKDIWLERDRRRYYGSLFVHVGVVFQKPLPGDVLVLSSPLITYRAGNAHTFSPKMFETMFAKWPSVVWSLDIPDYAKSSACSAEPWRDFGELLLRRGFGTYSMKEFRQIVRPRLGSRKDAFLPVLAALMPGALMNLLFVLYYSVTGHHYRGVWQKEWMIYTLRASRYHHTNWRTLEYIKTIFKRKRSDPSLDQCAS